MAVTEAKPVKQLSEILKEQQEPFILQVNLVQRGYSSLGSQSMCSSCHGNSGVSLKRSSSCEVKKSRKGIQHCSNLVRILCKLFISRDRKLDVLQKTSNNKQAAELDSFSSSISATASSSSSESDAEETSTSTRKDNVSFTANTLESSTLCYPMMEEVRWPSIENNKQDRPVSGLDNMASHTGSPPLNRDFTTSKEKHTMKTGVLLPKKDTEESVLSASLWKLLNHPIIEKPIKAGASDMEELVQLKPKMVFQKAKQLLFDWLREMVVTQRRKEVQRRHEYLGSQENGKLRGEETKARIKPSVDESKLTKLLDLDTRASAPEWIGYKKHARYIALEMADAIMEEVKNETVIGMIDL